MRLLAEEIATAYGGGESEYSLARRYGVSRNVIRRHLVAAQVEIRGCSAAGLVRASKMTAEERRKQAAASNAAARGSRRTYEQLCRHAVGVEAIGQVQSAGEERMLAWLTARGLQPVPQKAVGKYNVDIAVAPVAVEVLGGGWHSAKRSHEVRTPALLDAGWHLAFVWDYEGRSALTENAADYVVSFLEEVRRDPPSVSQYRVIAGNGELLAAGSGDQDKFTLEPPPRGRLAPGS